ncbi:MAG TPA: 2-hydroxyacyl-CoA dehydratase family protein [Chloroflexota bacterium]|nr:2-hydroxyacyl-CoA dehydratase family protein [Chloroflexota bacterium]
MTALDAFREVYEHRDAPARRWKAAGGKVAGYLCDNVPEELIAAAGFLPYRLSGDPRQGHAALERYVQPFAPPFSARNRGLGFTDAMLDMLLAGSFDFLDYLIVPHTRKAIQAYYRELQLAKQLEPALQTPELFYLDRAYTPFYAAEVFNREQVLALHAQLESWTMRTISGSDMADAVALFAENRRLLRQVLALRTADEPRLTGTQALHVIGAAQWMPREEHSRLLRQLLSETLPRAARGARLFLGGSPLDNSQLYELIESQGAVVVGEDHCWGARLAELDLDDSLEPVEALADRYHRKPACSIQFPMCAVTERCLDRARAARADGAIFFVYEGDGVHVWDTPDELRAFEQAGIPTLYLGRQAYGLGDPEPLRREIDRFLSEPARRK